MYGCMYILHVALTKQLSSIVTKIEVILLKYRIVAVLPGIIFSRHLCKMPTIKAVLTDLSGTLHIDDEPTANAVEALKNLRQSGISLRFVTNTTKESRETLYARLRRIGFELEQHEIFSSLSAAAEYVKAQALQPFYLVSKDARKDFPPTECDDSALNAVVVGLAPEEFHYENMNTALNILLANKEHKLVAINLSKYYKRSTGFAVGAGCYVRGLEYATGAQAVLIGKPNAYFFERAIPEGVRPEECVMIGDDANDDIAGAMKLGMQTVQVKTGKYLPSIVSDPSPTALVENFSEAVLWIEKNKC